ncbi:MAG TPA: DUF2135 domain-containing protein [Leptospiraceae bacterium]|nr:DUF2135 domain-containing protein [Leptospiraceae bacterium]HMW04154.1 DUF2135 domain-containing protein [Leptospiraceae bacterium]HMX34862.1 DUF2135 domain-containing protein [Leptospiraceae bacterium]HMY30147.1 DUF2135 domain-containing protein [Leptospiraceae bacterium]HMZ64346.1 DUF2135 domain-containing protein [Leptospiraceae bacterium]
MNYLRFLFFLLFINGFQAITSSEVKIESPRGGFTTARVIEITGTVADTSVERITLVMNGVPQTVKVQSGNFRIKSVVAPGSNSIEVKHGKHSDRVSFFASVPSKDIKIVLTWDTPTDVDLWVIDPKGEKTYYAANSSSSGGNLDVDVTDGYGPETFTMAKALSGSYAVNVQYYSNNNIPITRVKLYVILYEGTSKEEKKYFEFTMTKGQQVYHIADFQIEGD